MAHQRLRAFTLIVVSIIVLLMALLLPVLSSARALAQSMRCQSQLRQVGLAFLAFTVDHEGTLPGTYFYQWVGDESWQKSWMGDEWWAGAGHEGTIMPYIEDQNEAMYRCPSLPFVGFYAGVGSNGIFDYSLIGTFSGAGIGGMPLQAEVHDPDTGDVERVNTPLIVEEDPAHYINNGYADPIHNVDDRIATTHQNNTGNYASPDGSVTSLDSPGPNLGPVLNRDWFAESPSGRLVSLNSTDVGFGEWNRR